MRSRSLSCLTCGFAAVVLSLGCGDDSPSGGGGAGGAAQGGGGGEVGGGEVGGASGSCDEANPCEAGVCLYGADACELGAVGACQPTNGTCDGPPTGPVCDCAGVVHEGDFASCTLGADATPFGAADACATGTFDCGGLSCTNHVQVCVETLGGPAGAEPTYECRDADELGGCSFGVADCGCLVLDDLCGVGGAGCSCDQDPATQQETITIALP
jgi:hypothetical protein